MFPILILGEHLAIHYEQSIPRTRGSEWGHEFTVKLFYHFPISCQLNVLAMPVNEFTVSCVQFALGLAMLFHKWELTFKMRD